MMLADDFVLGIADDFQEIRVGAQNLAIHRKFDHGLRILDRLENALGIAPKQTREHGTALTLKTKSEQPDRVGLCQACGAVQRRGWMVHASGLHSPQRWAVVFRCGMSER
ncbi:hypothetical protein [Xanthobacter sp. VNH20]|uniref:hypothetical protein n=1 Tax=Xanthobacter sp. VNH20 TaxID=3156616 RepID=UPI0032B4BFFC